ncbi:hypothetical protein DOM22_14095 [Bdellovibrio sp. ZAP7]|uniref:hypothetical protein n=1 Tax=Bdellovibrio sp. ZAP7 TaxID=2231053 RepID=UPI00115AD45D|nr:hypothetical protein [Bdellovibrio sp. ZAP7]QDK46213.1 hypothetical protein DOM22_14095 [Bdellovibrio sp. ZAP7]
MKKLLAALSLIICTQTALAQDDSDITIIDGTMKVFNIPEAGSVITLEGDLAAALFDQMNDPTRVDSLPVKQGAPSGGFVACNKTDGAGKSAAKCTGLAADMIASIPNALHVSGLIIENIAFAVVSGQEAITLMNSMSQATKDGDFVNGKNIVCMIDEKLSDNTCFFGIDMKTGAFVSNEQALVFIK